jgi:PAS domain S-box-containing protein
MGARSQSDARNGAHSAYTLFADHPVPTLICEDGTLRVLAANISAVRHSGFSAAQLLTKSLQDLYPLDNRPEQWTEGARDASIAVHYRGEDGALASVRLTASRIEFDERPAWLIAITDISEQLRAEQALAESQKSERRFRQLFDTASDWFWEADAKGQLTYVSPNYEALYTLPIADVLGKRLQDVPGVRIDRDMAEMSLAAIKARQPFRDFIYSFQTEVTQTKRWVHTNGVPVFDEQSEFLGYRGVSRDITVQVEAERALRDSEQRFRELFDVASDYYWESDTLGAVTYLSPNYEAIFGIPPTQLLGKRLSEAPGVSMKPAMAIMAIAALKARRPFRDMVYYRTFSDGRKRWFKISGAPSLGPSGEFRGYRGVGAEITTSVEAEAAARLAERRLDEAVAYLAQPFVVYDAEDRIVALNQAFFDLHNASNAGLLVGAGALFQDVAACQLRIKLYAEIPGQKLVDFETLLTHYQAEEEQTYALRDGRWMQIAYRRLPGGGKVGLWTDITALKRAEERRRALEHQLQHSQRLEALGTLAGGIAHDLNNTLVPIVALAKLLLDDLAEDRVAHRDIETIVAAGERARDLVSQILAFSRKQKSDRHEIDLATVVHEALRMLRATLPATIAIVEEIDPVPALSGDACELQQVVVNLVTNAAQAIGSDPGKITIAVKLDGDGIRLSIADTGCGMDTTTMERIFEPFFTTKEVGEGTGLGLSVMHGIVIGHGGRIAVNSELGKGTEFDVFLPVVQAVGAAA